MDEPRADANCLICEHKNRCGKYIYKKYDENGKPDVQCWGFQKEMTEEDIKKWGWNKEGEGNED